MTETEMKLHDTETQFQLALSHIGEESTVRSCLNAFISNARSVTFVLQTESSDPRLKSWYDSRMIAMTNSSLWPVAEVFQREARLLYSSRSRLARKAHHTHNGCSHERCSSTWSAVHLIL